MPICSRATLLYPGEAVDVVHFVLEVIKLVRQLLLFRLEALNLVTQFTACMCCQT